MQDYTLKAEPALFVWGFDCTATCDPDNRNPVAFHAPVRVSEFAKSLRITDVTTGTPTTVPVPEPSTQTTWGRDSSADLTLEDAHYNSQPPASTYLVAIGAGLTSVDGQTLGYTWAGQVQNWHRTAFTSFGDGHGVWEASGGSVLPFYSRNLFDVKQWASPLKPDDLMPTIRALTPTFGVRPPVDPVSRKLGVTSDRIQSHGLDVAKALGPRGTGLVWAAVENGASIPNAKRSVAGRSRVARAGDEPRRDGQGQPAEHAGVRDPARQRRAGGRRQGLHHQPRQQHSLERDDRR